MSDSNKLAEVVGRIALTQAEIDEWLVQILISLLKPLPDSRVQRLVGKNSLDYKCSLIRDLAKDQSIDFNASLDSGKTVSELFTQIKKLNDSRDRAVHSYYDRVEQEQTRQFRSRRPGVEAIPISELESLANKLLGCIEDLRNFVELLEEQAAHEVEDASSWGGIVRGVHEVIVAGHLHERRALEQLIRAIDEDGIIRFSIKGHQRTFLKAGEAPGDGEFSVKIDPKNWLATITSPTGEIVQFGDTGWRDITKVARENDPSVEYAVIRRIGNDVLCSIEGGELAAAPWPQPRDRVAERAFGSISDPGLRVPSWILNLEGFAPGPGPEPTA